MEKILRIKVERWCSTVTPKKADEEADEKCQTAKNRPQYMRTGQNRHLVRSLNRDCTRSLPLGNPKGPLSPALISHNAAKVCFILPVRSDFKSFVLTGNLRQSWLSKIHVRNYAAGNSAIETASPTLSIRFLGTVPPVIFPIRVSSGEKQLAKASLFEIGIVDGQKRPADNLFAQNLIREIAPAAPRVLLCRGEQTPLSSGLPGFSAQNGDDVFVYTARNSFLYGSGA